MNSRPDTDEKTRIFKEGRSHSCYEELRECKLLNRYSMWKTKELGRLAGVVLLGKSKSGAPKTTYAKKFYVHGMNRYSEVNEFLAITALQSCGVLTPKVKLKKVEEGFYQFARDIAECHAKNSQSKPVFYPLVELLKPTCPYQLGKDKFSVEFTPAGSSEKRSIQIDKASLAKLIMSVIIFELADMHDENVGLLIDPDAGTAKLATVDLELMTTGADGVDYKKHKSLTELVKSHRYICGDLEAIDLRQLSDADYQCAVEELSATVNSACSAVKATAQTDQIRECLDDCYVDKMLLKWQTNKDELYMFTLQNHILGKSCKK